jgi:superfamily II RNA helicase
VAKAREDVLSRKQVEELLQDFALRDVPPALREVPLTALLEEAVVRFEAMHLLSATEEGEQALAMFLKLARMLRDEWARLVPALEEWVERLEARQVRS